MEATEQLSEVEGVPKETPVALHPELVNTLTSAGQVIVGGVTSVTVVTVVEAIAEHPAKSVIVTE